MNLLACFLVAIELIFVAVEHAEIEGPNVQFDVTFIFSMVEGTRYTA